MPVRDKRCLRFSASLWSSLLLRLPDLKQRKEVIEGGNSIYVPQAPVRAALEGRLLILDGLEKAERNVLPTLNNLLENRELSLDDGSMLVSPTVYDSHDEAHLSNIHRVHPDFRVAALGSLQGGSTLDPPLRSRFQARIQTQADPGELMEALANAADGQLDEATLQNLVYMATATDTPTLSLESLSDAARYLVQYNEHITTEAALNAHGMGFIGSDDVVQPFDNVRDPVSHSPSFVSTLRSESIMNLIDSGIENGKAVVCVGPKGCGKSAIAIEAARRSGKPAELFSLYKDMMSRDLLVTRGTDEAGNTIWRKTPLTRAVENGTCVILDGIDKLSSDTLSSIARLLEHKEVDLPDGTRLKAHPGFACIALAHPPESKRSKSWITPEVSGMFFWCDVEPLPADELKLVLAGMFPDLDPAQLDKIVRLRDRLESAIASGAADTTDEQESLMLSLRKMKHICRRLERKGNRSNLPQLVRDALMTSLMPDREQQIVETCMTDCGIVSQSNDAMYDDTVTELDEELLAECRRTPAHPLLVPSPRFEDNPGHTKILGDLLDAHSVGERALLVMGWQGVGKNRVVDSLLNRLQCEREYLQLHRDTTVQSLLSSPSVEDGRLVFKDSPLVRAALNGRILVVDEADKAPIEVVALLKGLIEDGELCLPDGRVLRYEEATSDAPGQTSIVIHPDFRVWALANPAGYPFHGNNLAKEMADVFSCHTVPALDPESQTNILKSYGPNLPDETIQKIIRIWQDLSKAHERGILAYPFSIREAVGVVRHLEKYPDDGFATAIDNVLAFDRFDTTLMKQLNSIFNQHGVKLQIPSTKLEGAGREGGISTPRTRASDPKHGKIDPTGNPHVGGNTWAGGTGGSDTAGLGGRGGPYRLDLGHKVHQVSDEMKAQVSEESLRRAKEMGERALEEKLKELNMGKLDWERYDSLRQRVDIQIQQLQVLLKDIKRRKDERVWLRRQSTGELDDSRIVDAIAGEKDVFKRRGIANEVPNHGLDNDDNMFVTLVVDVSASMYRFNSYDGRLERLLEATLMIMEALGDDKRFKLQIVGHNGSSAHIPLAQPDTSKDPATQLKILEEMIAHTQFTWAGDSTLEAIELAVNNAHEDELILVISDANLKRYRIEPEQVSTLLQRSDVHAHLVLVGSMGEEASDLASEIANGRAQVCSDSEELPLLMKNILASVTR
jgi:MoxR-like ATPase